MKAFVIAEHTAAAPELCVAARAAAADEVVLVVLGDAPQGVADRTMRVSVPEGFAFEDAFETVASVFDVEQPGTVFAESTRRMKVIVGRLAARAGVAVITDVMEFKGFAAKSLYFGGVAERVQKPVGDVAFYTVVSGSFDGSQAFGSTEVEEVDWVTPAHPIEVMERKPIKKTAADPSNADVVVAVGRGFSEESELDLARSLCDKLGAGLACSRPLTEGVTWLPTELYVGVSGLMLAPKTYVAVGISGQMQHMVGCNRSGEVFAINKDKNAPVFKLCDYGLVGDLKDVLPRLTAAL